MPNNTVPGKSAMNKLDSNADTCCAGENWCLLSLLGELFNVHSYTKWGYGKQEVQVGSCALLWTSSLGRKYIIILHKMLCFGAKLERSLINPNQLRDFGCNVQD